MGILQEADVSDTSYRVEGVSGRGTSVWVELRYSLTGSSSFSESQQMELLKRTMRKLRIRHMLTVNQILELTF
mgnify:CR=1 FL=1